MPFSQYKSIAQVLQEFPLTYAEKNFIQGIPIEVNPSFVQDLNFMLQEGILFNSEAAICENIIYPVLKEVWRKYADKLLLWSHEPLYCNESLSGVPDYMVAQRSLRGKIILEQPYLILVEAKKDNFEEGWGQCLAELVAAQKLNEEAEKRLFGIVSNGKLWEFGVLEAQHFGKSLKAYVLDGLKELMEALNFVFAESIAQIS